MFSLASGLPSNGAVLNMAATQLVSGKGLEKCGKKVCVVNLVAIDKYNCFCEGKTALKEFFRAELIAALRPQGAERDPAFTVGSRPS